MNFLQSRGHAAIAILKKKEMEWMVGENVNVSLETYHCISDLDLSLIMWDLINADE